MKVIVILEIDPDKVIEAASETVGEVETLEQAVEVELGWSQPSGMSVDKVFCTDGIASNDADLGSQIREILNK